MVIRIPVEVQTSESTEIRELLDRIDRAEGKLSTMRTAIPGRTDAATLLGFEQTPQTGITRDTSRSSRTALGVSEGSRTTPIGTPIGSGGESALPRGRGGILPGEGGPQDLVRQNQFNVLSDDVTTLEQKLNKFSDIGTTAVGTFGSFAKGGIIGLLKSGVGSLIPPALLIVLAKQIFDLVLELMLQPGGPWDRRFKRDFTKEYDALRSREQKGQLRTGQQEIRLSYGPIGKRVKSYDVGNTLSGVKRGIFNEDELSYISRGQP